MTSERALLQRSEPVFSNLAYSQAVLGPLSFSGVSEYSALALQNPNRGGVVVDLALYSGDGVLLGESSFALANDARILAEVSELINGVPAMAGSYVTVRASLPIQVFSVWCDEGANTVTPSKAFWRSRSSRPASDRRGTRRDRGREHHESQHAQTRQTRHDR